MMNSADLNVPDNIDKKIYECIRANKLIYEKDYYLEKKL